MLILGGTVAFLSCSDSLDDNGTGKGGTGGTGGSGIGGTAMDGSGPAGTSGCVTGCDGTGPVGGNGGTTGEGGRGGTTGVGGRGGTGGYCTECCGTGCGGYGGFGGVGGRGGAGGVSGTTGGGGRGGAGGTGGVGPCDGLVYFEQRGWCAPTYAAQAAKQVGSCDVVRVSTGSCGGLQVWTTSYAALGDPVTCAYDGSGSLTAARICTDYPNPAWNCAGAATSPNCLTTGTVPNIQSCPLSSTCDATGGRGGNSVCPAAACDGTGPIGGRGGA
jgi:hypothetical protein